MYQVLCNSRSFLKGCGKQTRQTPNNFSKEGLCTNLVFVPKAFYPRLLLHQTHFAPTPTYTRDPSETVFTPNSFYTKSLLHQTPFTPNFFRHIAFFHSFKRLTIPGGSLSAPRPRKIEFIRGFRRRLDNRQCEDGSAR